MARPRQPKETHRDVPVKTYWSDAEYAELLRRAKAARLPVSSYVRNLILGESVAARAA